MDDEAYQHKVKKGWMEADQDVKNGASCLEARRVFLRDSLTANFKTCEVESTYFNRLSVQVSVRLAYDA